MTDKKQPEALRLANVCSNLTRYSTDAHLIAAELCRQHAELETLRMSYKTALMYEELRAAIDGGHESMTHADALAEIAAIRAENETLRTGYAAARLEIESLRAAQHPSSAKGVAHG